MALCLGISNTDVDLDLAEKLNVNQIPLRKTNGKLKWINLAVYSAFKVWSKF